MRQSVTASVCHALSRTVATVRLAQNDAACCACSSVCDTGVAYGFHRQPEEGRLPRRQVSMQRGGPANISSRPAVGQPRAVPGRKRSNIASFSRAAVPARYPMLPMTNRRGNVSTRYSLPIRAARVYWSTSAASAATLCGARKIRLCLIPALYTEVVGMWAGVPHQLCAITRMMIC